MGMIFLFAAALLVKYAQSMLLTEPEIRSGKLSQERGSIFDRNGKILAAATTLYNVSANKTLISDPHMLAAILAPAIGMSESELFEKIEKSPSNFLYLKKKVSENEKQQIKELIKEHEIKMNWLLRLSGISAMMEKALPEWNTPCRISYPLPAGQPEQRKWDIPYI